MSKDYQFSTAPPAVGGEHVAGKAGEIISPDPPPAINLQQDEMQVYNYICDVLRAAGIDHTTAGISISVIVRTFINWIEASRICEERGRTQESKTGWVTPYPWADDEKRLKMELGQWLPKACLTIPSLARVRKDTGEKSGQDDLFGDLVNHAMSSPQRGLPN
ncbi:MAG: hypothetical protein WA071_08250 [Undibacterium umbellatum]|uniref:hypothetical protein n=1 Tax=Undibacterium umbellatum TaxID=2762300 RepID=UPI003BB51DCC